MARSRTPKFDASEAITNEIIRIIERGVLPWRKPWTAGGSSRPLRVGGEPYQGVNNFLLTMRTVMAGHSSPFWMTLPQANALSAKIRKGEKSSVVVYYGQSRRDAGDEDDRSEEARVFRFQKSYRVFNARQFLPRPGARARASAVRAHPAHAGVFRCHRHHDRLHRNGSVLFAPRGQGLHAAHHAVPGPAQFLRGLGP